jgi:5'-nucleotidase
MPENDAAAGLGGVLRQAGYINTVRSENETVLLFHSGDFVQGTPYFNLFGGRAEIACMDMMRYDAVTLGNHEFDNGLDSLARMLRNAYFPVVTTNLDFSGTVLEGRTQKYVILFRGGLKIGVIGLLVDPEGLITANNYRGMQYLDPLQTANETAALLKERDHCDLVICLSHLGYTAEKAGQFTDVDLAKNSRNIDIILGGHSHTLLQSAARYKNLDGQEVVIDQVGDKGIYMGRLDVTMAKQ